MTNVEYVRLDRGLVSVTGADRQTFLQGLISQDVDLVSEKCAVYGAFLTPQGKYLHDFCLAEIGERLILDGEQGRGAELMDRMKRFKLRAKVELSSAVDLCVVAVFGQNAASALGLSETPGAARPLGDGIAFVDPRSSKLGCRLIVPTVHAATIVSELPLTESTRDEYKALRIRLCIPDGTQDMDVEKSTLLECNFEALNGVDWDKGCYIGQEVTARTKYRGLVKRQLIPVSVDGKTPDAGSAIYTDGKQVGEIRSNHDGIAIASLRLDAIDAAMDGQTLTADGSVITLLSAFPIDAVEHD